MSYQGENSLLIPEVREEWLQPKRKARVTQIIICCNKPIDKSISEATKVNFEAAEGHTGYPSYQQQPP